MKKLCAVIAIVFAPLAHAAYKCVDERGMTLIGDVPPAGCAKVVMYEITPTGRVLRKIDPTPSPEQEKAMAEAKQREKEAQRAAFEQRRKDEALVNTYSSEKEIELTRDRNIEPIHARIASTRERIAEVDKRMKLIAEQIQLYKDGKVEGAKTREAPAPLLAQQQGARDEKATLEAGIADAYKEIEAVRARYEADRKRYVEIKKGAGMHTASERVPGR